MSHWEMKKIEAGWTSEALECEWDIFSQKARITGKNCSRMVAFLTIDEMKEADLRELELKAKEVEEAFLAERKAEGEARGVQLEAKKVREAEEERKRERMKAAFHCLRFKDKQGRWIVKYGNIFSGRYYKEPCGSDENWDPVGYEDVFYYDHDSSFRRAAIALLRKYCYGYRIHDCRKYEFLRDGERVPLGEFREDDTLCLVRGESEWQ